MEEDLSPQEQLLQAFSNVFTDESISSLRTHIASNSPRRLTYFNSLYSNTSEMVSNSLVGIPEDISHDEHFCDAMTTLNYLYETKTHNCLNSVNIFEKLIYLLYSLESLKALMEQLNTSTMAGEDSSETESQSDPTILKAVTKSFDSNLISSGIKEKERLSRYISWVHSVKFKNKRAFNAPIINVCQSSGCGKSKIATDIMNEIPAIYVVIRRSTSSLGFPLISKLAKYFDFVVNPKNGNISDFVVLYYVIVLYEIFKKYSELLNKRLDEDDILKLMSKSFISGEFDLDDDVRIYIKDLKSSFTDESSLEAYNEKFGVANSKAAITKAKDINVQLAEVLKTLTRIKNKPPLFILDEASLLTHQADPQDINMFRLLRRAIILISNVSDLVTLTLGTNSDVMDLNRSFSDDSYRIGVVGKLLPPFILSRNWDVFLSPDEMKNTKIGYDSLQCGRLGILHVSLGRVLWASVPISYISDLANTKITNNSIKTGEAYLAAWLVRIGITVNPSHSVCKLLVKSLMARIMFLSEDLTTLRVDYPSEPALAFAARKLINPPEMLMPYYEAMLSFVQSRALDQGRMAEVVSADITLQALAKAPGIEMKTWGYLDGLPRICRKNVYILEDDEDAQGLSDADLELADSDIQNGLEDFTRVVTLKSFIETKFGSLNDDKDKLASYVPKILKSAFANVSHFVQMTRKFPFKEVMPVKFVKEVSPVADPSREKGSNLCNIVTSELLEIGVMRSCGHIFPENYFGLDYQFPITLNPDLVKEYKAVSEPNTDILSEILKRQKLDSEPEPFSIRPGRPTYSYIGVQVKKASNFGNIRPVVAKCAISNHLVRCGKHQGCADPECQSRIPDQDYKAILGNGLAFVHVMESDVPYTSIGDVNIELGDHDLVDMWLNYRNSIDTPEKLASIFSNLKSLLRNLCPEQYWHHIEAGHFSYMNQEHFKGARFMPDVYISINISTNLKVHFMAKKTLDSTGIIERITVIESRGLEVFENVLPKEVAEIAQQIIASDTSIFDELKNKKTIKYREMVQNFVSCNNDGSNPSGSNLVRTFYDQQEIPDILPDYKNDISTKSGNYYCQL